MNENSAERLSQSLNIDKKDVMRSPIAYKICELADRAGLFCYHYEYRYQMPRPDHWYPYREPPTLSTWQSGILQEEKYQAFRNDGVLGSFHPGQSSKWGSHELLHKLLGFCWQPGGDLFFHTIANWLAEILPVATYYFFDEVESQKCAYHAGFAFADANYCALCEEKSQNREINHQDIDRIQQGKNFVSQQIQAVRASLKAGRLEMAPYLNINLAKDAFEYAKLNLYRLDTAEMHDYMKSFPDDSQYIKSFDIYIARIESLMAALVDGADFQTYQAERKDWQRLDLLYRIYELKSISDEQIFPEIDAMLSLAKEDMWQDLVNYYSQLEKSYDLPKHSDFFALGHEWLEKTGKSYSQIKAGIRSVLPSATEDLDIKAFILQDKLDRRYLGDRLCDFFKSDKISFEIDIYRPISMSREYYFTGIGDRIEHHPNLKFYTFNAEEIKDLPIAVNTDWLEGQTAYFVTFTNEDEKQIVQLEKKDFEELKNFKENKLDSEKIEYYIHWNWLVRK